MKKILKQKWIEKLEKLTQEKATQSELGVLKKKLAWIEEIEQIEKKIQEAEAEKESDSQLKELWVQEIENLKIQFKTANENLKIKLISQEKENIILEIRACEGGDEASLFAQEISNLYQKLAQKLEWKFNVISLNYKFPGGLKEGVFEIIGTSVEQYLANESGVHCVKRVPKTEKKGRIHTSTITVAILKQPTAVEVVINANDLKIDVFRSSGPGGQSVNTTDSAVRITHIPSGLVVSQQDEKSQHKNKEKALKILRARLYAKQQEEQHKQNALERKEAIGGGQRNERIRTYHFTQNWVKDERIEIVSHDISTFMEGDGLIKFLDELIWNTF